MTIRRFVEEDYKTDGSTLIDWSIDNDFVIISKWLLEDGELFEFEHCSGAFVDWIVSNRYL